MFDLDVDPDEQENRSGEASADELATLLADAVRELGLVAVPLGIVRDDEPALRGSLEEALENFAGCAVVISHDRWFLDRIATHILAFEGDSQVVLFNGNWTEYEADRKKRLGVEAEIPKRIKYRQLTRYPD